MYKSTCNLFRLKRETADRDRETYQMIRQGLHVNIQPAGLEYLATEPDGAMGKTYRAYTTYSGCQIGMILVSSGTTTVSGMKYDITGIEDHYGPFGRHWELLLRKSTN